MDNTKKKNITSLAKASLTFVLAALMIFALFLPIFKVGNYDAQFSKDYTGGNFTQYTVPVGEGDYGFFTVLCAIKNYRDIYDILKIQSLEAEYASINEEATTIYTAMFTADSEEEQNELAAQLEALGAELEDVKSQLDSAVESLDEARQEAIVEKIQDEDFVEALVFCHYYYGIYTDLFEEKDESVENYRLSYDAAGAVELVTLLAFVLLIPVAILVFAISLLIKLIMFVVKLAKKGIAGATAKDVRFPFFTFAAIFFVIFLVLSLFSLLEVSAGIGFWLILAAASVSALAEPLFGVLSTNKKFVDALMNAGVSFAAVFLCVFLALQVINIDVVADLRISGGDFNTIYTAENSDLGADLAASLGKANVKNTVIVFAIAFVSIAALSAAFICFLKQLSMEGKVKSGAKHSVSRIGMIMAALLLVIAFIPSVIGTSSGVTRYESMAKGNYKMLWDAHIYSDTNAGTEYSECSKFITSCKGAIEKMEEQIESAEDVEAAEKAIGYYENYLEISEKKFDRITADKKNVSSICMVSAVSLIVVQFIYTFIMYDDKKKKAEEQNSDIALESSENESESESAETTENSEEVFENSVEADSQE